MDKNELATQITNFLSFGIAVQCRCGVFFTIEIPASVGRNPRTGEAVPIPARPQAAFYPSADLIRAAFGDDGVPAEKYRRTELEAPDAYYVFNLAGEGDFSADQVSWYRDQLQNKAISAAPTGATLDEGALFDDIASALAQKKTFKISGLGAFATRQLKRSALRRAELDATEAVDIDLADARIVFFKPSIALTQTLRSAAIERAAILETKKERAPETSSPNAGPYRTAETPPVNLSDAFEIFGKSLEDAFRGSDDRSKK